MPFQVSVAWQTWRAQNRRCRLGGHQRREVDEKWKTRIQTSGSCHKWFGLPGKRQHTSSNRAPSVKIKKVKLKEKTKSWIFKFIIYVIKVSKLLSLSSSLQICPPILCVHACMCMCVWLYVIVILSKRSRLIAVQNQWTGTLEDKRENFKQCSTRWPPPLKVDVCH